MSKNVMIPLNLLEKTICLLEGWDVSRCSYEIRYDYGDILWALKVKMQKLELRETYAKIIAADNPDARHDARMEYLRQKSRLGDVGVEVLF